MSQSLGIRLIQDKEKLTEAELDFIIFSALKYNPKKIKKIMSYAEKILGYSFDNYQSIGQQLRQRLKVHQRERRVSRDGDAFWSLDIKYIYARSL